MKNRIATFIIALVAVLGSLPVTAGAWGTDFNVNPGTNRKYKFNRVTVAYDGTIYLGRVFSQSNSPYDHWEVLKSTDSGATFTSFKSGVTGSPTQYTAFDIVAAGNSSSDFHLFIARAVLDTTNGDADLYLNKVDQAGTTTYPDIDAGSFNYSNSRGYTSLSLATDTKDPNTYAYPYCIAIAVGKASPSDSIVVWTANDGGNNFVRRGLYGTPDYIRTVSAAMGSASSSPTGRLAVAWDQFDNSTDDWGALRIKYVFPDDATDPAYTGPYSIGTSDTMYRNPSAALSLDQNVTDITTLVAYEYNFSSSEGANIYMRNSTTLISAAPSFPSSYGLGNTTGDQLTPNVVYNAATDSFLVTHYDDGDGTLNFGISGGTYATPVYSYRDAISSLQNPMPRVDAIAPGHAYFTWNEMDSTYFEREYAAPASVQSLSVNAAEIKLYPNPATDKTTLNFTAAENDNITLTVIDLAGRALQSTNATISKGGNIIPLTLINLPAGNYTLRLSGSHTNTALIFTVVR